MAEKKKEKHKCPAEPWAKPNVARTPAYVDGDNLELARARWNSWLSIVVRLQPMPRKTHG